MANSSELSTVHDLFFPSPPTLVDLASMRVGLDLWRHEIIAHRTTGDTLRGRDRRINPPLSSILPNVPLKILSMIQPYAQKIGLNIGHWLYHHAEFEILRFEFLNKFCDFVIEFDGNIDHTRTARRIVSCGDVSDEIKFKIACWYCLEDDVVRLWPSVKSQMSITSVDFHTHPHLYYWLNKMQGTASDGFQPNVETRVLDALYEDFHYSYWPAVKYFWNKLDSVTQKQHMTNLYPHLLINEQECIFLRYIMAQLNEDELRICVQKYGHDMVLSSPSPYIIRTWTYVKHAMTEYNFHRLVSMIFLLYSSKNMPTWCEIWATAPNYLKGNIVIKIATEISLFRSSPFTYFQEESCVVFILAILSDASPRDRSIFWNIHRNDIVCRIAPKHLRTFVDLCLCDDLQKNLFKKEFISSRPDVMNRCFELLRRGYLSELEEELTFWCPDQQTTEEFQCCKRNSRIFYCTTINDVRLHLLHDNFDVTDELISKAGLLSEFIGDAFNNNEHALVRFKNQLLVGAHATATMRVFKSRMKFGYFRDVMEFVDLFALSAQIEHQIKERITLALNEILNGILIGLSQFNNPNSNWVKHFEEFENFIPWLFGSNEKILEFKITLESLLNQLIMLNSTPIEDHILPLSNPFNVDFDWFHRCFRNLKPTDLTTERFLKWYFVTPEAVEEFRRRYLIAGVFRFYEHNNILI